MLRLVAALLVVFTLAASSLRAAQLQQGTVRGTVRGPDGLPVAGVTVSLLDALGNALA